VAAPVPQLKVIFPPLATAAASAAVVQLAGVPVPTTWLPVVSASWMGAVQVVGGGGGGFVSGAGPWSSFATGFSGRGPSWTGPGSPE